MSRLIRPAALGTGALVLAGAMTLASAAVIGGTTGGAASPAPPGSGTGRTALLDPAAGSSSVEADPVADLQARLGRVPGDHRSWSALARAYVERARVTADPTYYPKAERAVARAAELAPADPVTLTARASLAAARHEFRAALRAADLAIAAAPHNAAAWAIRSDALTELGRYEAARRAAARADDLEPGPSTYARLSYQAELRGEIRQATRLMRLARNASTADAPTYAFASFHLGELSRARGDLAAARRHYAAALTADPSHQPARVGLARLAVARGDTARAEREYLRVVSRLPLPEYLGELADLYLATGRPARARAQLEVAAASARLAAANGVRTDLETALLEADHGSPGAALRAARAEWSARQTVHTADAMAWALHALGRDAEALRYARRATFLGTRDARLVFHRGAIEAALGHSPAARRHLQTALRIDAGVAPLRERQASDLLRALR